MNEGSIKVGVIMDLTGPLAFLGVANANVAKMVIDEINAKGGLLGRRVELIVEDSATTDSVAEAKAAKLVEQVENIRASKSPMSFLVTLAVIITGLAWMFGYLDLRRAGFVIMGLAILFGASEIVGTLTGK